MGNDFSVETLKVKSNMASSRMKAHIQKKENAMTKQRREIAQLLVDEKEQSARIKVEGIIREENTCSVMEWLEMMCDLIHQRVKQIESSKECPEDLTESICSILYCAKRIDIPELGEMGRQFAGKWGQKWLDENIENRSGRVSKQIIEKLSVEPPTRETVVARLKEIAKEFSVEWEPNTLEPDASMPAIVGHRNEYTIEFDSKPFGMNWTPTEDGKNLWVSAIASKSQAATKGVIPGSMLIALNGIDIKDMGSQTIFEKSSSCGLPLRVTFRRPVGINVPTNNKEMSVDSDIVNKCVGLLKDPNNWEMNDKEKEAMCKKQGANAAEIAAALFLANYIIENANQQSNTPHETMNANNIDTAYPGPSSDDFSSQPNAAYSATTGNLESNHEIDLPDAPSSKTENSGNDLDDLEKRFAKLKTGI